MTTVPDYGEDSEPRPSDDALATLHRLCGEQAVLELRAIELEKELQENAEKLKSYRESLVPSEMSRLGLDVVKTKGGGLEIELRREIRASFPKDDAKRQVALAWLKSRGEDGLVKRCIEIRYGRDSTELADKIMAVLEREGVTTVASVTQDLWIEHPTLVKFVKDQLEAGADIPMSAFGAHEQMSARMRLAGKKGKK